MQRSKSLSQRTNECLSEELLQKIQSILLRDDAVADAARTREISKSWLNAWSTIPILRFKQPLVKNMKLEFLNLVDDTLVKYHRNNFLIESFKLLMFYGDEYSASLLRKWLHILANKNNGLKELDLSVKLPLRMSIEFPSEIFFSKTLQKLVLVDRSYSKEEFLISCEHIINCHSLQTLELHNVCVYESFGPGKPCTNNNEHASRNLRNLILMRVAINDLLLHKLLSKLPFIEKLVLSSCESLERINIHFDSLNHLVLGYLRKAIEVKVHAPKLRLLSYAGWMSEVLSFSDDTPTQLSSFVCIAKSPGTSSFLWLKEVLMRSRKFEFYTGFYNEFNVDLQHLRSVLPTPIQNVEIVSLGSQTPILKDSTFVDALFSICHPKYVRVLCDSDDSDMSFSHIFSAELSVRTNPTCCVLNDDMIKCWRHYLKDVEFGLLWLEDAQDMWQLPIQWRSSVDGQSNCFKLTWDLLCT